jgi:coenzyme F420-0:L-glutamate ligase/coenzyme F420-1:gamma-L-glutamate ligase
VSGDGLRLEIRPVLGIGEVRAGDDLAALISDAAPWLADGDVLVVTSKIVSKAEGRLVAVPESGPDRAAAREVALLKETAREVARRGQTRIVQTHHGFVMASAGIDASNVDRGHLVLLPLDPDASARALRGALRQRYGLDVAVLVSDTMGRPWRTGLTDVALGAAGIDALRDYRGEVDAHGNELHITQMAVIDELCAAAELVKNKYDQVPVAVVRGLDVTGTPDGSGAAVLIRDPQHDLFSLGTAEAVAAGLRGAATLADADVRWAGTDAGEVLRILRLVGSPSLIPLDAVAQDKIADELPELAGGRLILVAAPPVPLEALRAGTDLHRFRAALAAEGLASVWREIDTSRLAGLPPLPPSTVALGLLAVGLPD